MSMYFDTLPLDSRIRYYKPKRNDKKKISVYNKPNQFSKHLNYDVFIKLSKEVYHIGCSGNLKKQDGVSTCHAYLVGQRVKILTTFDQFFELKYDRIRYDHINAIIYAENSELREGDICLITVQNEVYKVTKS